MAAFETLIRRHQDRLFRLSTAFLYRPEHREDAVQEVFVRAFSGMPRFQFRSKPFTWLYRTLQNVCREYNREGPVSNHVGFETEESKFDEGERIATQEELQAVMQQLDKLSKRERDVVLLRIFEEFNVEETAITLGIRQGTVKTLLHRGLQKLRDLKIDIIR